MPRAIRFDRYGDVDELYVADVPVPDAEPGRVVVRVSVTGLNPGEDEIRQGTMAEEFPAEFPSGQGSDFAGVVEAVGADVDGFSAGDPVFGWSDERSAQADFVSVPADHLAVRPDGVPEDVAGALAVVGFTALSLRDAARTGPGEVAVVAGASGGVGVLTTQLLRLAGARVIGLAGEAHHELLRRWGAEPLDYRADGLVERIRAQAGDAGVTTLLDAHGGGYVDLGLDLGLSPERVVTIIDFDAAERHGAAVTGQTDSQSAAALDELAGLVASGDLELPIEARYPLEEVREAYRRLADGHVAGKIVLALTGA